MSIRFSTHTHTRDASTIVAVIVATVAATTDRHHIVAVIVCALIVSRARIVCAICAHLILVLVGDSAASPTHKIYTEKLLLLNVFNATAAGRNNKLM